MHTSHENESGPAGNHVCRFIEIIDYNGEGSRESKMGTAAGRGFASLGDIPEGAVRWINIEGQCAGTLFQELGALFHIHPLVIRNIGNSNQRTKIEEYRDFLHIVAKMIYYSGNELVVEHMNFILGRNFVITIGERPGDVFDDIRGRIRSEGTQIRKFGADYLMYSLLDAIVDGYFAALEVLNEKIDLLEEREVAGASQAHLRAIREIKKSLLLINRCVWPLREVASLMGRESAELICPATKPYIRDIYDHIIQVIETTEMSRELLSGLTELHLSNTSYKLNEIMKTLTVISTVFMPLTFIAGVYGMNFRYMPELQHRWGYWIVWVVMLAVSGLMMYYFRKKKWF